MRIAIYCRIPDNEEINFLVEIYNFLKLENHDVILCESLRKYIPFHENFFSLQQELVYFNVQYLFSFGGDGTLIEAADLVGDANIPLLGINTGRIGFLTGINKNDFTAAYKLLSNYKFKLEERALLHLETNCPNNLDYNFALNDISLHSIEGALISPITVWLDDVKVNTYWADGLIIATPSGSTAYSLSCGGPIVTPNSKVNIITPIASHSLSVRPMIVPSEQTIKVVKENRNKNNLFLLTLDHHRDELLNGTVLTITNEKFTIKTIKFEDRDFFSIIREKLLWGIDRRNNQS